MIIVTTTELTAFVTTIIVEFIQAAWPRGLQRRFNDDHDYDCMVLVQFPPSSHCCGLQDKALCNNYLCLVASNKQQINRKVKESSGKLGNRQLL